MNKEDFLKSDFAKDFKSGEEFMSFMSDVYKRGIECMLEGELDQHLGYSKHVKQSEQPNARNGYTPKSLKTDFGKLDIKVPRDRKSSFEPVLVPKRKGTMGGIENLVISLYAKGLSTSDIEEQIRELYGYKISSSVVSTITDRVISDVIGWQNRPLDPTYLIVWMDGIVFKVREGSKVIKKTIYLAIGLRVDGKKEVLGMWLGKNESSAFWMTVLSDLKARGVEDILITVTDNLNGFTQTINAIYPKSDTQICVVHQIRNATKYVVWKDKKEFTRDMKTIYTAPNKDAAKAALKDFSDKWKDKYEYAIKSWENNWDELTVFFDFPAEIRKIIYTTNTIENMNGLIRKYTKNKQSFPTDDALKKSVYLAIFEITKKWTSTIRNWGVILNQFILIFEDRIKI